MLLRDWLSTQKMSEAEFARVSGIGFRQLVHKYASGSGFPSPDNLVKIREATGGQVTANDFVDHHVSKTRPASSPHEAAA